MNKLIYLFKIIRKYFWYLIPTIYFNFHYLPFKQAIKLPIFLYKPKFICLKGKVIIESERVRFCMIELGPLMNTCNPNCGISIDNRGGTLIFKGRALFNNDSYIMIMPDAVLTLGKDLDCNCKIKCAKSIEIGDETWIAYDTMIMDSDWHALTDVTTGKLLKKEAPVKIGKHNFISYKCIVTKGAVTPNYATFMPGSLINTIYEGEDNSLFGGNPCELIDEGYYLDHNNN